MLTCRTLGEAITYVAEHEQDAGALLRHRYTVEGKLFSIEVTPRLYDPDLEPYLVEEALSCDVAIARSLIGAHFNPIRVDVSYAKPDHAAAYGAFFKCPVRFGMSVNRLVSDARWLEYSLPTYEEFTCPFLQSQLESLMPRRLERNDLLESIAAHLRAHLDEPRALLETAQEFNISERTLRRRLTDLNVSYRSLVDQARHERAVESATPNVRLAQRDRTCHRLQRRTELSAGVQALDRDAPWRLPSWLLASGNSGRTCIERVTPVQGFKGAPD
jgi:hypothetical protein